MASNFIELLIQQTTLITKFLLNRNEQDTRQKWCLYIFLAGNHIQVSTIVLSYFFALKQLYNKAWFLFTEPKGFKNFKVLIKNTAWLPFFIQKMEFLTHWKTNKGFNNHCQQSFFVSKPNSRTQAHNQSIGQYKFVIENISRKSGKPEHRRTTLKQANLR